ncbi:MAG: hypothetical protein ABIQ95_15375 [Bdellovibrionia bacterium]
MVPFLPKFVTDLFQGTVRDPVITLSGRLDLERDPQSLFRLLGQLYKQLSLSPSDQAIIDLKDCEFIYPAVVLLLLGFRESLGGNPPALALKLGQGTSIHEFLESIHIGEYFDFPELPVGHVKQFTDSTLVSPLQEVREIGDTERLATKLFDLFRGWQAMTPAVAGRTVDSFAEILRNVKQHSGSNCLRVLGQAYPESKNLRFCFYDNGIGIKSHLTRRPYAQTHGVFQSEVAEVRFQEIERLPANAAIEEAARYMVSSTDYEDNSGAGLEFLIRDLSLPMEGKITIVSQDGYVRWEKGEKVDSFALPFEFRGTLVSVTVHAEPGTKLAFQSETR